MIVCPPSHSNSTRSQHNHLGNRSDCFRGDLFAQSVHPSRCDQSRTTLSIKLIKWITNFASPTKVCVSGFCLCLRVSRVCMYVGHKVSLPVATHKCQSYVHARSDWFQPHQRGRCSERDFRRRQGGELLCVTPRGEVEDNRGEVADDGRTIDSSARSARRTTCVSMCTRNIH